MPLSAENQKCKMLVALNPFVTSMGIFRELSGVALVGFGAKLAINNR
jgi:hypothetical protein